MYKASSFALYVLVLLISSCQSKPDIKLVEQPLLPGDGFGIGGVTLLVKNPDSATKYYRDTLGFAFGDELDDGLYEGTKSAALGFADQFAIEVVGIKDSALVHTKYPFITRYLQQLEGVREYFISTSSAAVTRSWLQSRGYTIDTPRSGRISKELPKGWDWDDGEAEWRSLSFKPNDPPADLPNFIEFAGIPYKDINEDWKPYSYRKWYPQNKNGVVGASYLTIVVKDLAAARQEFKKMGLKEIDATDSAARFSIAHAHELHLVTPGSTPAHATFAKTRGSGVFAIGFEVASFDSTFTFFKTKLPAAAMKIDSMKKRLVIDAKFAHGVQLEFSQESKQQSELAKIYSFTEGTKLDTPSLKYAEAIYTKYCALCHGKDREGYAADNAPSLRSKTLLSTTVLPRSSYNFLQHTITYGRPGTAMAPYAKSQGGPLDGTEIELLLQWIHEKGGVTKPIEMSTKPVAGNIPSGSKLYATHCASCHGMKGEGISAPALANPMFLATASDAFIRHTISEGRDSTPMPAFKDSLTRKEIDAITAYVRSGASGWTAPGTVSRVKPQPKDYILNPSKGGPTFTLKDDRYVSAEQLLKAIKDSTRMIILDARSEAAWHQSHMPGAVPVPYYKEPEKFVKDIPNDSTWVVVYCACPHAASTKVVNTLRRLGYKHTAILDEGILVWAQRGYPIINGTAGK